MSVGARARLLCLFGLLCGGRAHAQSESPPLQILFHADVDGRLVVPACGKAQRPATDFAALAGAFSAARAAGPSLTLLGGNATAPGLFARQLVARPDDSGVRALADVFAAAGYGAVALGHHDLSVGHQRLAAWARAVKAPLVATNLCCDDQRQELCQALHKSALVAVGDERVGVVAVLSPALRAGLAADVREGLSFADPSVAVKDAAKDLRARGATRVIVMADVPRTPAGADELVQLQRSLRGHAADVILAAGLFRADVGAAVRLLEQDGAPAIVGSEEGTASVAEVRLAGHAADVIAHNASAAAPDPNIAARLRPLIDAYCARHGGSVGNARAHGAIDKAAFTAYVLATLRRAARAEIALLNHAFIKSDGFPWTGGITHEDLERAMPYEATVGVARVTGAQLLAALGPALASPKLAALGAEASGGSLSVNGRPLDPTRHYRVATIDFVATGGDNLLPAHALPLADLPGSPSLRQLVTAQLAREAARTDGDPTIDPATDFGAPASARPLWVATTDVAFDFGSTSIEGAHPAMPDGVYAAPQLTRARQRSVKGDATAAVQLRAPAHEGDARVRALYGWTRSRPEGGAAVSAESADLLALSATYNYRGARGLAVLPDPYVRALLESEITRPPRDVRSYRHAELTATIGAMLAPWPKLRLRGGPGLRKQLLADGEPGHARFLIEGGATLEPVGLISYGPLTTQVEGQVDYAFVDPQRERQHQLKGSGKVSVPLLPLLYFTAGVDVYAAQQRGAGWAAAYDTTVGLKVRLDTARQGL